MPGFTVSQQIAYERTSTVPLTPLQVQGPTIAGSASTACFALACLAKFVASSNPWAAGLAIAGALPGMYYGPKLYTQWIPELLRMGKGEVVRKITNVPNVALGLIGWKEDSTHSNHFDQTLADALVGMCQGKVNNSIDYDCGGRGLYASTLRKAGITADAFDFSAASVTDTIYLTSLTSRDSSTKYDLVTSFEAMSKTLPGDEEIFVRKLVNAAKPGGVIVMSCAVPGQPGPNSNCLSNEVVEALFAKHDCTYDDKATWKLRNSIHGVHTWLNGSVQVFIKKQ